MIQKTQGLTAERWGHRKKISTKYPVIGRQTSDTLEKVKKQMCAKGTDVVAEILVISHLMAFIFLIDGRE